MLYNTSMAPSLIAIAGPLSGATLPLADAEVSIGRDDGNVIALGDQRKWEATPAARDRCTE